MVKLSLEDRKQLLRLLEDLPEMRELRSRQQLLEDAGLSDIGKRIDLSGAISTAVRGIVDFLCEYGSKEDEQEVLASFLLAVRELVGQEKQDDIERLLVKYRMVVRQDSMEIESSSLAPVSVQIPENESEVVSGTSSQPFSCLSGVEVIPDVPLQVFSFTTVRVNENGEIVEKNSCKARQFVEDLGRGVKLEMIEIPGGSFMMGSPEYEKFRDGSETPQHKVTVSSFYLGKYPITQGQWEIADRNPSRFKGKKHPVEHLSWLQAEMFCQWLSKKTKKLYRLPSEAEWEYACRADTTTPFHFGKTLTANIANYRTTSIYASEPKRTYREQTTEVGSFPPNAFGLHDMHGNVWEWCADTWHSSYQSAPTNGGVWVDKKVNNDGKVLRGGSWRDSPRLCRSACRKHILSSAQIGNFGFRICCSLSMVP